MMHRQQGDGGGVFGDNQFTSTLSVNFPLSQDHARTKKAPIRGLKLNSFYPQILGIAPHNLLTNP